MTKQKTFFKLVRFLKRYHNHFDEKALMTNEALILRLAKYLNNQKKILLTTIYEVNKLYLILSTDEVQILNNQLSQKTKNDLVTMINVLNSKQMYKAPKYRKKFHIDLKNIF